jgi:asparagine synthase (glutamine-hydrolysing)
MTAIFGLWHRNGRPHATADAARMGRSLAIYGPDRSNSWSGGDLVLGADLSFLLPEDRFDRQPLAHNGVVLAGDIRLDNRTELAAELAIAADDAAAMPDAAVALAAWTRWGEKTFDRLIGDWALAVWDSHQQTLTLARDFLGNRPLFYRADADRFAFASMAKGLHALPDVPYAPDFETMRDHLALLPANGPKSFFAGLSRVEPGSLVVAHADGHIETRRWYVWHTERQAQFADDGEAIAAFRAIFDRAVADRLRATGPIASTLSGGFDSTAVSATAARLLGAQNKRLTAYTAVPMAGAILDAPKGRIVNEWPLAHRLAECHANIDHIAVDSAGRAIGDDFDADFFYNEMPMPNPCNGVWLNEICRQVASQKGHVLLLGNKGNATISYDGLHRLPELLSDGRLLSWMREASAYGWRRGWQRAIGHSFLPLLPPRLTAWLRRASGRYVWSLAHYSALRQDIAESAGFRAHAAALAFDPGYHPLKRRHDAVPRMLLRVDAAPIIKGSLAAYRVDLRDPTDDRRLVELCLSLPLHFFLRHGQTKWLYHHAFGDRIPRAILEETRKGYQGADWLDRLHHGRDGMRGLADTALGSDSAAQLIDVATLSQLMHSPLPQRASMEVMERYRLKLLRGLSDAHFLAKATPSNCPVDGF